MLKEELYIRNANLDDTDLLYSWSNNEQVRKQSFQSSKIEYNDHCKWFENKLKDDSTLIFIVETNQNPVGVVRFQIDNKLATIGVSIDEDYRGKGLGATLIEMGVHSYFKEKDYSILASIKKQNTASIKSFKKAGFLFLKDEIINDIESVVYQLKKAK